MKHIAVVNGAHCCYESATGRDRHYSGCDHGTNVRAAIRHIENHPYTSPTRAAGTGSPPSPGAPPHGWAAELVPASR